MLAGCLCRFDAPTCSETAKLRTELRKADEQNKKLEYQLERGRRLTEQVDAGAEELVEKVVGERVMFMAGNRTE